NKYFAQAGAPLNGAQVGSSFASTFAGSYNAFVGTGGDWQYFSGSTEATTGTSFTGSANRLLDLYYLPGQPDGAGDVPGTYLGTFQLDAAGNVGFTAGPEPTSYGMVAGIGLLILAVRRQLRGAAV